MRGTDDVSAVITGMTDGERPFLGACLTSVLADPGIGKVILCIQDSNTWIDEVLAAVGTDSRLQVIRMPLAPPGAVRNEAVKHVKTEWLAFCDGDDVWCKGKTLAQRAYALENNCDFVGSDHYLTDEPGRIRAIAMAEYLPMTSSWLVRTRIMREHPFKGCPIEDAEWWKRTSKANAFPKARCPKLLLRYRVRAASLSSNEPFQAAQGQGRCDGEHPSDRIGRPGFNRGAVVGEPFEILPAVAQVADRSCETGTRFSISRNQKS